MDLPGEKPKFDLPLEGLRGLACLLVLHMHLAPGAIDKTSPFPTFAFNQFVVGEQAVLIFFLISGYVIGLGNRRPYTATQAKSYLWKRAVRLVPLCWIAILLSVLAWPIDPPRAVLGNFFFLQDWFRYLFIYVPTLSANPNLWSLHYEVIYYLTFLAIWRWRPSPRQLGAVIAVLFLLGVTGWFFPAQPLSLTAYAVGGVFWYAGLWLAWYGRPLAETDAGRIRIPWVSIWLLFFSVEHIGALLQLLQHNGWIWARHGHVPIVSMIDYQTLPLGLIILAASTARELPLRWLIWPAAWAGPILFLAVAVATSAHALLTQYQTQLVLLVLAGLLWPWRQSNVWLVKLAPVGFISYGIYIFARPAENFVTRHLLALYEGAYLSYPVRLALILALTFGFAYLGEQMLQPRIRAWLSRFNPSRGEPETRRPVLPDPVSQS